jgi:hypothetical protein
VFGGEDVLVVVDEHNEFKVFLFIPLAFCNFLALVVKLRFREVGGRWLNFDLLQREGVLIVLVDCAIYEGHVMLILYRISGNHH